MTKKYVSLIGAGAATARQKELAVAVGRLVGERGHVLVCGGLGGVMEAAAQGCVEAGGLAVGLLPGKDRDEANRFLTIALPTRLGEGRNYLVAAAGDGAIAIGGGAGTMSEIALALKAGKPVILLESLDLRAAGLVDDRLKVAVTPVEAVNMLESMV